MDNKSISNEKMHSIQSMRDKVKEEIDYIPRGDVLQNELRMFYGPLRMRSLGKKAKASKTRYDVLNEAINKVKKGHPDFKPKIRQGFFKTEGGLINP